ncbi:uncharacterized protein [Nicotiana sylvestris]|uniref:uncharacterized protein n=1 Tax=Nicotiana sylvestris TaxID=4096 RepID=UPI00388CC1C6
MEIRPNGAALQAGQTRGVYLGMAFFDHRSHEFAYAPQAGLDEEVKRHFWESLDEIVQSIPPAERLLIGGDFHGHIGSVIGDYGEVHGGFGFGDRNGGGSSLLDFAKAFELALGNGRRYYDKEKKRYAHGQPRIRWGVLTKDKAQELEGRLSAMGAWRSSEDASTMWATTANCIREAAREVLGISKGHSSRHQGDWRWNDIVQGKVEAKKEVYMKLVGSTCEEDRRERIERGTR